MCGEFLNQAAGREVIPQGSPLNGGIGAARDKLFGALRGHGASGPLFDFLQHGMGGQPGGMPQAPGATGAPNPLRSLFPQFGGNSQTPQAAQSPSIPLGVGKGPFG